MMSDSGKGARGEARGGTPANDANDAPSQSASSTERRQPLAASERRVPSAGEILLRRWPALIGGAVLIALITFAVSEAVPATYASSAMVAVQVSGTDANDTTLGANNLASQYASEVNASQVLSLADSMLPSKSAIPSSSISGSTVSAQNLVSISATGSSPSLAQERAAVVTRAFIRYINAQVAAHANQYEHAYSIELKPLDDEIAQDEAELGTLRSTSGKAVAVQLELNTLLAQRASSETAIAQTAVAGRPSVTLVSDADTASQSAPRPKLYALVGFIVGLLVLARFVVFLANRPSRVKG